jgi:hypothetical protein
MSTASLAASCSYCTCSHSSRDSSSWVSCSLLYGSCTLRHVGPLARWPLAAAGAAVALMGGKGLGLGVAVTDAAPGRCATGL